MHEEDFVFPVSFDALPGGQLVQSVALATPRADEYVAAGHAVQAAKSDKRFASVVSGLPCLPAPHRSQLVCSAFENFPRVHSTHSLLPYTLLFPEGHGVQT